MKSIVRNLFWSIFLLVLLFVLAIPLAVSEEVISNNSNATSIQDDINESFRLIPVIIFYQGDFKNYMVLYVENPTLNDVNIILEGELTVPKGVYIKDANFPQVDKNENRTIYEGDIEVPPGEKYIVVIQLENYLDDYGWINFNGKYYPCNSDGICLKES